MEKKTDGFNHTVTINLNDEKFRKKQQENVVKCLEGGRAFWKYFNGKEWVFVELPKK